jgi:hypothetical protein
VSTTSAMNTMEHSGDQTRPVYANDSQEAIRDSFRMPLLSAHRTPHTAITNTT